MLPPPKIILRVALLVLIFSAFLFAPWPGAERIYRKCFCTFGNILFARLWFRSDASTRFIDPRNVHPGALPEWALQQMPAAEGEKDVAMALENRKVLNVVSFKRTSSWRIGYVPTAMFLAWGLATPIPWLRKLKCIGLGLALVHVFIFFRISLTLLQEFGNPLKNIHVFDLGSLGTKVISGLENVLHDDPTVSYVVPTFIWILLMFRPGQWSGTTIQSDHSTAMENSS